MTHCQRVLVFQDNHFLGQLFGMSDRHLALLEQEHGVSLSARGNRVFIHGLPHDCARVEVALLSLYDRLQAGDEISPGDVRRVSSMAASDDLPDREASSPRRHVGEKGAGKPDMEGCITTRRRTILARSPIQKSYIHALEAHDLVFASGPAGTGKTYLAVAHAVALLENGLVDRLVLCCPAVEAGERLGFLPGDMREKVDPYLRPLYDALHDIMGSERVERSLQNGAIEIAPLAFMRGRTLANAVVILDEAQNCTARQMKMFLTRLGENSRMIVAGDPGQVDLPYGQTSGLVDAMTVLADVEGVAAVFFSAGDVTRSALVLRIVRAYDAVAHEKSGKECEA